MQSRKSSAELKSAFLLAKDAEEMEEHVIETPLMTVMLMWSLSLAAACHLLVDFQEAAGSIVSVVQSEMQTQGDALSTLRQCWEQRAPAQTILTIPHWFPVQFLCTSNFLSLLCVTQIQGRQSLIQNVHCKKNNAKKRVVQIIFLKVSQQQVFLLNKLYIFYCILTLTKFLLQESYFHIIMS